MGCSTETDGFNVTWENSKAHFIAKFFQKSCIISLEDDTQKITESFNIDTVSSQVYAVKDAEGDRDQ